MSLALPQQQPESAPHVAERSSTGLPHGKVAMWWFLASEIAIFGGLIACFVLYRLGHPEWSEFASETSNAAGGFNTLVLLSSSLLAVLAHDAASHGEARKASNLTLATAFGGVIFLCVKSYEYGLKFSHHVYPTTNLFWGFYFFMTALHAAHVIAGMTALTYVGLRARKGEWLDAVEYAGMYWHLVDVVWIFLFPLIYLAS